MYRYIKSSAMKKSDISDEIQSHTIPLIESLAQLYLFPQYEKYHKHWKHEVWNQLSAIPVLKKSHKIPKSEFILEHSWYRYKNRLKILMNRAKSHENTLIPDRQRSNNLAEFYNICDEYFHWLAYQLHKYEVIDEETILNKLADLGL